MSNIPLDLHLMKYYIPAVGFVKVSPTKFKLHKYGIHVGYTEISQHPWYPHNHSFKYNGESDWQETHLETRFYYKSSTISVSTEDLIYFWDHVVWQN